MDELIPILRSLDLEPYTRWSDAHARIQAHDRFANDAKFQTLTKSDVLTAFENHIKALERTFNDERQHEKALKARREREARDAFIDLLGELRAAGKLKAGTAWNDVFATLEHDPRYTNLLGQSGSGPLDLFRDELEEAERALRSSRNTVYDVLEDRRYEVTPRTAWPDFQAVMAADRRTAALPRDALELLFARLRDKVARRAHEDEHAAERQRRRAVDALRSRIRKLDGPPVRADDDWAAVRRRVEAADEFRALPDEELRKQAFDKVVRRLKEKDDDAQRERAAAHSSSRARDRNGVRGADRDARTRCPGRPPQRPPQPREGAGRVRGGPPQGRGRPRAAIPAWRRRAVAPRSPRRRSTERDRREPRHEGRLSAGFDRERERDGRREPDRERPYRGRAAGRARRAGLWEQ